jgi:hypothetical protein
MVDTERERRRFQRIFFSVDDGIEGTFTFPDLQKGILTAHIINVNEGGLGLALSKDKKARISKGEYVILAQIKGITGLEPFINVQGEIKWILENRSLEFIGFGCEFLNLSESRRDAIRTFIDAWCTENIGGEPGDSTAHF